MAVKEYKKTEQKPLSKNFRLSEFRCKCHNPDCTVTKLDDDLVVWLQKIRDHFGRSVNVNSGYRCEEHNAFVGGDPGSHHKKGMAADIRVEGILPEEVARYALMKSMALDKNYVDTTTFDVLQPAIDYYFKKGSPDERLRTYYYQGRIYQNRGDDDLAMQSFMRGREYCQGATDTLMMANLMVAQATIQDSIYKMDEFIKNNLEAARLYQTIVRTDYEVLSLNNVMDGCILTDNKVLIDSVMLVAQERVKQYPDCLLYTSDAADD